MSAVWQTLIPETPSTEPIAIVQQTTTTPSGDDDDQLTHVITTSASSGSTTAHPPLYHPALNLIPNHHTSSHLNNIKSSTSTHRNSLVNASSNHSNYNYKSHGLTHRLPVTSTSSSSSSPSSSGNGFGAQFWRFYSSHSQKRLDKYEKRKRLFLKGGEWNTRQINVFEKGQRYIGDIFTTLVDAQWRWTLFVFSFSYISSWIIFAIIWWIILTAHGDIEHFGEDGWTPCVQEVRNFASVFLFSVETQHTIGYGHHRMTDTCTEAIITLCLQSIAGVLIEAFMVGVVFAKLSRPKKRSETLAFSKNAVICQRDGKMYLMFRVGDLRNRSHIFEAHVRSQVITKKITPEGEIIPLHQEEIKVGGYGEDEDRILLFWPTLILHPIDTDSPFYNMSPNDLLKAKLEVLVVMEGVVESTGMTTQARTSYLPSEILWGHRFQDLSIYKSDIGEHIFDFDLFNSTFPVETPHCSARDLDIIIQNSCKSEELSGGKRELVASSSLATAGIEDTTRLQHHDDGNFCNNNNNNPNYDYKHTNTIHGRSRSSTNTSTRTNKSNSSQHSNNSHNHNNKKYNEKQILNNNIELSLINNSLLYMNNNPCPNDDDDENEDQVVGESPSNMMLFKDHDKAPLVSPHDDEDVQVDDDDDEDLMMQQLIKGGSESQLNLVVDDDNDDDDDSHSRLTNCNLSNTNSRLTNSNNKITTTNHNNNVNNSDSNISCSSSSRRRLSRTSHCDSFNFSDSNV